MVINMKKAECYYEDYSVCTCTMSANCDKKCVGGQECPNYISGDDYFSKMLAGEIKENAPAEDRKVRQQRINNNLSLGKTKKQLKYEARQEAERERRKNEEEGFASGFSLMDDPRFKDVFGKK